MREIKFRAYSEELGQFFYVPSESFSLVLNDTQHSVQLWSSDGLVDQFPVDFVEQFTGLKGKNGKEIYEGDDVRAKYQICTDFGDESGEWIGSVCFSDGGFKVNTNSDYSPSLSNCRVLDGWEVIGNIHETPEILESGNE